MADVVAALGASAHPQDADLRQTQRPGHQRCAVGLQALAAPPTGRCPVPDPGTARGGGMNEDSLWKAVHRMDAAADSLAQAAATIGWGAPPGSALRPLLGWLSRLLPRRINIQTGDPHP